MKTVELICIGCPMGCMMKVSMEDSEVISVTGNTCRRGDAYARKEVTNPTRIVTTTVRVDGGRHPVASVKTREAIPKAKASEYVEALRGVRIKAPVKIGDVVLADVAGTGVDAVATKNISGVTA